MSFQKDKKAAKRQPFNVTYYTAFRYLKRQLKESHVALPWDGEH